MTGWILFVGLVCGTVGAIGGFALGIYSSALGIEKMIKKGEIIYTDKSEVE